MTPQSPKENYGGVEDDRSERKYGKAISAVSSNREMVRGQPIFKSIDS